MVSLDLTLLSNLVDESLCGVGTVVLEPVVQAFISHVLAEMSAISCEACNGNAHVVVNVKHLFLVRSQVVGTLLQGNQHLNQDHNSEASPVKSEYRHKHLAPPQNVG